MVGTVTVGAQQQTVQITRLQAGDSERIQITIAGRPGTFTWSAAEGARLSGSSAVGSDRSLIERVVLDSPDQFVLAQLREASYYTIARSVRPAEAGGSTTYTGPVWDVVRVGEPDRPAPIRPLSRWRLYYINSRTGLIDRIISEEMGERIVAEITGWVTQGGETVPSRIVWRRQSQTVMEYTLTSFVHSPLP